MNFEFGSKDGSQDVWNTSICERKNARTPSINTSVVINSFNGSDN